MKRWRHFLVTLLIVPSLAIYVWIASIIIEFLIGFHFLIDFFIYFIMGILWILPATVVIKWLAKYEAN